MLQPKISTQYAQDSRGWLLDPCEKRSLFKAKLWKWDGREKTLFSKDFTSERKLLKDEKYLQLLYQQFQAIGVDTFAPFNGFQQLIKFFDKLYAQGNLRYAQLYFNQIKEPNPKAGSDPVPILLGNYADNRSPEERAKAAEQSLHQFKS